MARITVTKPTQFENINPTGNGYEVTVETNWEVVAYVSGHDAMISIHTTKHWILIPKIYIAAWLAVLKHITFHQ